MAIDTIYGIPCRLKSSTIRHAIRIVLRQVRQRAPKDFERIRSRVRGFVSQPKRKVARELLGEWKASPPPALVRLCRKGTPTTIEEFHRRNRLEREFDWSGVVRFGETTSTPVALVAHELGHACTREKDFSSRVQAGIEGNFGWASEMCADSYAYKWGFGREIARSRKNRSLAHHGPPPRKMFSLKPEGGSTVYHYWVTRRFYMRLHHTETLQGKEG